MKEKSKGQQSHDLIEPHMAFHRKSRRNSDEENLILLSEGCELILLNKQSFMACADVDTICKIEQLVSRRVLLHDGSTSASNE